MPWLGQVGSIQDGLTRPGVDKVKPRGLLKYFDNGAKSKFNDVLLDHGGLPHVLPLSIWNFFGGEVGGTHVPLILAMLPNQSCWFWLRDVLWGRPPDKLLLLNAPLFLKSIDLYKNQTQRWPLTLFGRDCRHNSRIVQRWQKFLYRNTFRKYIWHRILFLKLKI